MKNEKYSRMLGLLALAVVVILLMAIACSSSKPATGPSAPGTAKTAPAPAGSPPPASQATPAPTDIWSALFQRTPYPYTTPLPPPTRTILDGTYAKFDPREATRIPCRRCPDYFPYNGVWKLSLDNGIVRILHPDTGWCSYLSFTVSEDQILLFNDPNCPDMVGVYTWKVEKGALTLKVIEDECAIRLRAVNLTDLPWRSCQPPNTEAAVSDHWLKPPGCQ